MSKYIIGKSQTCAGAMPPTEYYGSLSELLRSLSDDTSWLHTLAEDDNGDFPVDESFGTEEEQAYNTVRNSDGGKRGGNNTFGGAPGFLSDQVLGNFADYVIAEVDDDFDLDAELKAWRER